MRNWLIFSLLFAVVLVTGCLGSTTEDFLTSCTSFPLPANWQNTSSFEIMSSAREYLQSPKWTFFEVQQGIDKVNDPALKTNLAESVTMEGVRNIPTTEQYNRFNFGLLKYNSNADASNAFNVLKTELQNMNIENAGRVYVVKDLTACGYPAIKALNNLPNPQTTEAFVILHDEYIVVLMGERISVLDDFFKDFVNLQQNPQQPQAPLDSGDGSCFAPTASTTIIDGTSVLCKQTYEGLHIVFRGSDATLECMGATLKGNNEGTGIKIEAGNATVRGCIITNYHIGINVAGSGNTLQDNMVENNTYVGISRPDPNDMNLLRSRVCYNTFSDLYCEISPMGAPIYSVDNTYSNAGTCAINEISHNTCP